MVNTKTFRDAWSRYPTGVALVTTIEPDGSVHGMLANGINSVSMDPFLVLLCVDHKRDSFKIISDTCSFTINVLSEDQKFVLDHYLTPKASRTKDTSEFFSFTEHGSAVLESCITTMECRVVTQQVAGDHSVFIAEVEGICVNPGKPLIFFEGKYTKFSDVIVDC